MGRVLSKIAQWVADGAVSVALILGGAVLIVAGLVMLVTPGPGLLAIAAGLSLWAKRFGWAQRLLQSVKARIAETRDQIRARRRSDPSDATAPDDPADGDPQVTTEPSSHDSSERTGADAA